MTKQKTRKIASQRDLLEVAGSVEAVVSEFSLVNLHGATYRSDVWSELCLLMGYDEPSTLTKPLTC